MERTLFMLSKELLVKAARLVQDAKDAGVTLATAESCTGGLVSALITAISGSSAVYLGSIVSYANEVKNRLLGVPAEVLAHDGAVSEACAKAMAAGARKAIDADYALAITGLAGPGGATPDKPVGLVYLALATPTGGVIVQKCHFAGDRDAVRTQTAAKGLDMLLEALA